LGGGNGRVRAAPEGSGAERDLQEIGPRERGELLGGLNSGVAGIECSSVMLHLFQVDGRSQAGFAADRDRTEFEMMVATYFVERFRAGIGWWVIGQDRYALSEQRKSP
jgi:hypothetical protein